MRRNARKPLPQDERLASREMPRGMPVAMIMGAWRCCEACGAGNGPGRRKSATPHPRRTRQVHNNAGNHADAASRRALLWGPTIHPGWLLKCQGDREKWLKRGRLAAARPTPGHNLDNPQVAGPTRNLKGGIANKAIIDARRLRCTSTSSDNIRCCNQVTINTIWLWDLRTHPHHRLHSQGGELVLASIASVADREEKPWHAHVLAPTRCFAMWRLHTSLARLLGLAARPEFNGGPTPIKATHPCQLAQLGSAEKNASTEERCARPGHLRSHSPDCDRRKPRRLAAECMARDAEATATQHTNAWAAIARCSPGALPEFVWEPWLLAQALEHLFIARVDA